MQIASALCGIPLFRGDFYLCLADTGDDTMTAWDEEARVYYDAHNIPVMLYSAQALVLAWAARQPHSIIPVFSARNLAQLTDSLCAGEMSLTPEEVHYLQFG